MHDAHYQLKFKRGQWVNISRSLFLVNTSENHNQNIRYRLHSTHAFFEGKVTFLQLKISGEKVFCFEIWFKFINLTFFIFTVSRAGRGRYQVTQNLGCPESAGRPTGEASLMVPADPEFAFWKIIFPL